MKYIRPALTILSLCFIVVLFLHCFSIFQKQQASFNYSLDRLSEKDYLNITYSYNKSSPSASYGNIDEILKRKELVICALKNDNHHLFQMKISDAPLKFVGEDIRLASELGKALSVKVTYKMAYDSYNDVVEAIQNGEGDLGIAKLSYTAERARKISFSNPYIHSKKMILINRMAIFDGLNNTLEKVLNNKKIRIGVIKNSSYEEFAKKLFPNAQIIAEKDWDTIIAKLKKREVDAIIRDEIVIKALLTSDKYILLNFMPVVLKGENDPLAVVANTNSEALIAFIDVFLAKGYKEPTSSEIIAEYS